MCKESGARESGTCPGCGRDFAFLPFHVPHCKGKLPSAVVTESKREREAHGNGDGGHVPAKRRKKVAR